MASRAERTFLSDYWWTIDRWLLGLFIGLMVIGFLFGLAAYPPVAVKLGLPTFHFVQRQAIFLAAGAGIMLAAGFGGVLDQLCAGGCNLAGRHGDQGRAALDQSAGIFAPTL